MEKDVDWNKVSDYLNDLYAASDGLEEMFPGRKFTLDGHLVGSVGEVLGAYIFDLDLKPASSPGHDAKTRDGRDVEIKLTQGTSVGIRREPDHLIVLHRPKDGPLRIVFNGPGTPAWNTAGKMQKNGQCSISLTQLSKIDRDIPISAKLEKVRRPPV